MERLKAYLYKQQLVDQEFFADLDAASDALAAGLRAGCLDLPDPPPLSVFDNVTAAANPLLEAQRERFAAYLDSFVDAP